MHHRLQHVHARLAQRLPCGLEGTRGQGGRCGVRARLDVALLHMSMSPRCQESDEGKTLCLGSNAPHRRPHQSPGSPWRLRGCTPSGLPPEWPVACRPYPRQLRSSPPRPLHMRVRRLMLCMYNDEHEPGDCSVTVGAPVPSDGSSEMVILAYCTDQPRLMQGSRARPAPVACR